MAEHLKRVQVYETPEVHGDLRPEPVPAHRHLPAGAAEPCSTSVRNAGCAPSLRPPRKWSRRSAAAHLVPCKFAPKERAYEKAIYSAGPRRRAGRYAVRVLNRRSPSRSRSSPRSTTTRSRARTRRSRASVRARPWSRRRSMRAGATTPAPSVACGRIR